MDRWNALPGVAPHGARRLDWITVGHSGKRPQAKVLRVEARRAKGSEGATRAMGGGLPGLSTTVEGTICLICNARSRLGARKCRLAESLRRECSMNWRLTCERMSNGG